MSYADHEQKKAYVITYKELVFTFLVFTVILFVLYPKDLLKEQILSENSNYDLSILYLKNLLKHSPEDESLMLILAEQSLRSGKKDLSIRLLELVLKSSNPEYRKRATVLSYELQKEDYFYFKDEKRKREQRKLLRILFTKIFYEHMYKDDEIDKWYKESMFVNVDFATYFFLEKKIKKDPRDIKLLEQAYYLAKKLRHRDAAFKYVKLLEKYDKVRAEKWLTDEYYMYINFKQYAKAERVLVKNRNRSEVWENRLAEFYLMQKSYQKASKIYSILFDGSVEYKKRRKYFYKSIRSLQAGNYLNEAAQKIHAYEDTFLNDIEVRKFMLRTYMATGNLNYASRLSKKILKKELK